MTQTENFHQQDVRLQTFRPPATKIRYGCAAARNKGGAICSNRATIERDDVEDRVLSGLKHRLLSPDLLEHFTEEYRKAFNASAAEAAQDRQKAAAALTRIETKIAGILQAIEDGMYHASMKEKMSELEAEQSRLQSVLAESPLPCGCIPACLCGAEN